MRRQALVGARLTHHRAVVRAERMHERRRRDGAGEMRDDADGVRLTHGRDFDHLGNAADVRQRRADVNLS